jgi:hypothetical protein
MEEIKKEKMRKPLNPPFVKGEGFIFIDFSFSC